MTSWLREPLLHFAVIGGLIFALYQGFGPKPANTTVIVVDAQVRRDMIDKFSSATQREPTPKELAELIDGWVAKEVLYREGLANGLDRSDGRIREVVIANMQTLIRTQAVPDSPPEDELRRWFEARRAQFDEAERYDFMQGLFTGDAADGQARAERASLALASAGAAPPEQAEPQVRGYRGRTYEQLVKAYGEGFAAALGQLPPGEWRVLRSDRGWHVVRLDRVVPPRPATFERLKEQLDIEWRREREFQLAAQAQREMRTRYTVVEGGGK